MTPERWRQIDDLFDAALRIDANNRKEWLHSVCGSDDALRVEICRLLDQDEGANRNGFLTPPETQTMAADQTASWGPGDNRDPHVKRVRNVSNKIHSLEDSGGFAPKAAIAGGTGFQPSAEVQLVMRARLRELPLIYILLLGMVLFWSHNILQDNDPTIDALNMVVIVILGGIVALLSSTWPVSLAMLKALELGMIGILAGLLAFAQYRLMLLYSLRDDPMLAQLTMKNTVLLTSILILTYGLYVPKNWRRAAIVVIALAILPFVNLLILSLQHIEVMMWLERGWRRRDLARIWLFSFDAMLLLVLAIGATFGARAISSLRKQIVEAKQLGQYRLLRHLGAGGMGEVYLAEHQLLKRPCAIKLIREGNVAGTNALKRFEREVRITATLSHPNTIEIFDYGRTEDGTYYYVMEYLPGLSLAELVEHHGPLPPGRAVYLLRQVCLALREAHAEGLIHRDIKPSNIFAARRGGVDDVAKLLDFGLVRPATTTRSAHLSEEGQILGTPMFMSPEQATSGRELDERSDIYSLGAVAYYMLTGHAPFEAEDGIAVLIAHARDPVPPPSQLQSGIPQDLEYVVLRCLAKDPNDRYADAESLEHAFGNCPCAAEWNQVLADHWWKDQQTQKKHNMIS